MGTDKEWFWGEWEKAARAEETAGCGKDCSGCGMMKNEISKAGVCRKRKEWFGEDNETGIVQTEKDDVNLLDERIERIERIKEAIK